MSWIEQYLKVYIVLALEIFSQILLIHQHHLQEVQPLQLFPPLLLHLIII